MEETGESRSSLSSNSSILLVIRFFPQFRFCGVSGVVTNFEFVEIAVLAGRH